MALSVLMTWPLAPRLGSVGRTANSGDARHGVWNVAWVANTLITDPRQVFDANIFYPHRRTLAFSEANLGAGAVAVPVWWLTRNPIAAYNSVVLLGFAAAFVAMWYLARHLTGSSAASTAAGILFAFCPYLFSHTAHIQLLMAAGIPASLLAFHRAVERPTVARGLLLGLAIGGQALFCAYYGIFAALAVSLGGVFYAAFRRRWASPTYWMAMGVGALVSVAVVLPFFLPYLDIQESTGFARSLDDARMYSATLRSYLASSAHAHGWILPLIGEWNGVVLFPGFVAVGLGLWAVLTAIRRIPELAFADERRAGVTHGAFYGLLGLLTVWASLGPSAGLYTVLHEWLPIFSFLRAPARMGIVGVLALAVSAAFAVRALTARTRPGWRRAAVTVGIGAVALADLAVAPIDWRPVRPIPQALRALADRPRGPLVVFPFYDRRVDFHVHTRYMLNSTAHWQPLVNGYSDYIPPDFRNVAAKLASFPSRESFEAMRSRRVRYLAVHKYRYSPEHLAEVQSVLGDLEEHLQPVASDELVDVYEIVSWPR